LTSVANDCGCFPNASQSQPLTWDFDRHRWTVVTGVLASPVWIRPHLHLNCCQLDISAECHLDVLLYKKTVIIMASKFPSCTDLRRVSGQRFLAQPI
jgi:hypothetical protein